ncbi:MAG TPA: hypothetical protein VL463_35355 [Kofleriaceae bacterium]|jgi:hypothetical protein|nr:hypothetical protein [Kofleriaceae bacterium]
MDVSVRQITLAVSGTVVLAMSLYLYVKVRAAPAQPSNVVVEGAKLSAASQQLAQPPAADHWDTSSPQAREESIRNQLVAPAHDRVEPPPAGSSTVAPQLQVDDGNVDDELKASDGLTMANKMFDRGDWEDASKQALKMLETDPKNAKMLRIVVSVACFTGDPDKAQKYWSQLSDDRDKAQMSVRCGRYGIQFKQ